MYLYYLFFFGLVFDFKGVDDGGNNLQLGMFFITTFAGMAIIYRTTVFDRASQIYRMVTWLLWINLVSTCLVAIILNVEFARYLRIVSPYVLLVLGFFVGARIKNDIGIDKAIKLILTASVGAIIFTVAYGFLSTGVGAEEIRYQILSPMMFVAIPIFAYNVWIIKRRVVFSIISLLSILFLIVLGATRSWLIAYIGIFFTAVILGNTRHHGIVRSVINSVAMGAIAAVITFGVMYIASPDAVVRMLGRIFSSEEIGFDITTATRLAEIDFQIAAWLSDFPTTLFGNGLGAAYGFSGEHLEKLIMWLGEDGAVTDWWFAGHNFWIYSLFTQGILFGWIMPFLIIYCLVVGLRSALKEKSKKGLFTPDFEFNAFIGLMFLSTMLSTIGGNPMGSRMLSLYIGIAMGMAFIDEVVDDSKLNTASNSA